jgi:hypothetical protein
MNFMTLKHKLMFLSDEFGGHRTAWARKNEQIVTVRWEGPTAVYVMDAAAGILLHKRRAESSI